MPRPASQQGIHPVTQTLFLAYSMWDPEIHSTKQTIISAWTIYIYIYEKEREREIVRTLTPGASAPRNTACADDMASPSDFLFSISLCDWDLETRNCTFWDFCERERGLWRKWLVYGSIGSTVRPNLKPILWKK